MPKNSKTTKLLDVKTNDNRYIPYARQSIDEEDLAAVIAVLKSDFITQGPAVERFEDDVIATCHANFAIAVNSATSALHLACLALDVGPGDRVWTSPISFVASANCALYCGAEVDFVDIDRKSYNMSTSALEQKLINAKKNNKLPKVVIAVHLCGQSCEMEPIHTLSRIYDFQVIEDASHAIGGQYQNHAIGNCKYSDITIFSFHPVKIITTAEGGMALCNDSKLARKMRCLRSHGITREKEHMTEKPHGPWYYQQRELGFNYRMTDLQAALGSSQLKKLACFISRRKELARRYDQLLADQPIGLPWQHKDTFSARHLYVIRLQLDAIEYTHKQIFIGLREKGIGVNLHYIPIHLQPFYKSFGFKKGDFPNAEQYYREAISLPLFASMSEQQQSKVCDILIDLLFSSK